MLKIYNTKTRSLEEFKPLSSRQVKVYHCWPTVYDYAHIWNLKTYVWNDMITRVLRFLGYDVKVVMNITDIDDKTIKKSKETWEKLLDFTTKYTRYFLEDIKKLNIIEANEIVPISWIIPEMQRMINTMLKRWNAYLSSDWSIYFKISSFKKYWQLANLDMSWMKESVRINNDEYDKDSASDFALWKSYSKDDWDNYWEEIFEIKKDSIDKDYFNENIELVEEKEGSYLLKLKWRPGWHIECSACNMKYLWQQIDLHTGWIDNLFPHHQNEVAQTESCTKKEFSKYWAHHWHLTVDGKKMSKSLKNFYTLRDLEDLLEAWKLNIKDKSILYRSIRLSFLNWRYRDSIDFSFSKLESISNNILSIDETLKKIKSELINNNFKNKWVSRDFSDFMQDIINEYIEKLEDDFNMPEAFAVFFSFLKFINVWLNNANFSFEELNSLIDMLKTFDQVLWIIDFSVLDSVIVYSKAWELKIEWWNSVIITNWENINIPDEIILKLEDRNKAKKEKDFELADKLRLEIEKSWYKVIDDRSWTRVEKF